VHYVLAISVIPEEGLCSAILIKFWAKGVVKNSGKQSKGKGTKNKGEGVSRRGKEGRVVIFGTISSG
jgi:hypothetical protein